MKISRLSSFPDELWSIFATVKALDLSVYIFCNDPSSWRFLWWSVPNRLSFPLMVLSDCFVCRSRHDSRDENRNMYLDPATTDSWTLWVRSCFWLCLCVFYAPYLRFVYRFFEEVQIFQKRSVGEEGRTTKITQTNKLSSILYGSS